jgi:membrane protease YdiL (CAAX protease family)
MNVKNPFPQSIQQSVQKSILLHILPGVLIATVFVLLHPWVERIGYPPLFAFLLGVFLVGNPVMISVLLIEGRRINGRLSLAGVVLYRDRISWKTFAIVFAVMFVFLYLLIMVATPVSAYLKETLFSFLPDWVFLDEQAQYMIYPKNILIIVFSLQLIITGILLPGVEELYFRGYLLPRISRFGKFTPLLGGVLFGMYHVWQLFDFPLVALLGVGLSFVVWWKKDLRLSIALHILANVISRLMFLMAALAM